MRIKELIEHLKMFPEDMEVYIQTVPSDFASPLSRKLISLIQERMDEKYGLEPSKLLFTAHIPMRDKA